MNENTKENHLTGRATGADANKPGDGLLTDVEGRALDLELVDLLDQKGGEHADQDLLLLLGLSESVVEGVKVRCGQQSDKLQAWT